MTDYSPAFYASFREVSRRSARRALPALLEWVEPRSVVDVGCGVGTWLAVCRELGVDRVLGIDGAYAREAGLEIPDDSFLAHDLGRPLAPPLEADLALCLEVGEHLPATAADTLIASLTALAPVVAFSAAVPGQGGTEHVNEQWPGYWARRFEDRGFLTLDLLRPRLWDDPEVAFYYAQNLLLYVRRDHLPSLPALAAAAEAGGRAGSDLARVHPVLWLNALDPRQAPLKRTLRALPHAFRNAWKGFRQRRR